MILLKHMIYFASWQIAGRLIFLYISVTLRKTLTFFCVEVRMSAFRVRIQITGEPYLNKTGRQQL